MIAGDRLLLVGFHSDIIDTLRFNHCSLFDVTNPASISVCISSVGFEGGGGCMCPFFDPPYEPLSNIDGILNTKHLMKERRMFIQCKTSQEQHLQCAVGLCY